MPSSIDNKGKLRYRNKPILLLHACCAPCSTAVYEKLCSDFAVSVYWYNPNVFPFDEHDKRLNEIKKLSKILGFRLIIDLNSGDDHQKWLNFSHTSSFPLSKREYLEVNNSTIKELANSLEGGPRCWLCYQMRLEKVIEYALENNFDYFATTLTVSPHKNAPKIIEIGKELEQSHLIREPRDPSVVLLPQDDNQNQVQFLAKDFKKDAGYQRSIELSKKYDLYRQNYCGCEYSLKQSSKLE